MFDCKVIWEYMWNLLIWYDYIYHCPMQVAFMNMLIQQGYCFKEEMICSVPVPSKLLCKKTIILKGEYSIKMLGNCIHMFTKRTIATKCIQSDSLYQITFLLFLHHKITKKIWCPCWGIILCLLHHKITKKIWCPCWEIILCLNYFVSLIEK